MSLNKLEKFLAVTSLFLISSVSMTPVISGSQSSHALSTGGLIYYSSPDPPADVTIIINEKELLGSNRLSLGVYIGSIDTSPFIDDPDLRQRAEDANVKMVAFMENRLYNDHPCKRYPTDWDWSGVDLLIQRIFEVGAEPFVTLGFCYRDGVRVPAGMAGRTSAGYATPDPEDWGTYCAEWVKHFKEVGLPVRYFDIMHEAHQYYGWGSSLDINKMDYIISLFNAAATKMRSENPSILIGNDDAMMNWVLPHYISKAEILDYFCWHRYLTGSKSESDSSLIRKAEYDEGGDKGSDNFIDPARQSYFDARGVWLPAIQAGGNLNYAWTGGTDPRLQSMTGAVCLALSLKLLMLKGVEYNTVYTFAGRGTDNFGIVNVDTTEPYYPYYVYRMVGPNLRDDRSIVESSSSSTDIATVAWLHDGKLNILLINKVQETRTVALSQVKHELSFWKIDNNNPGLQTGTIGASETITMNGYTVMFLQTEASP